MIQDEINSTGRVLGVIIRDVLRAQKIFARDQQD